MKTTQPAGKMEVISKNKYVIFMKAPPPAGKMEVI